MSVYNDNGVDPVRFITDAVNVARQCAADANAAAAAAAKSAEDTRGITADVHTRTKYNVFDYEAVFNGGIDVAGGIAITEGSSSKILDSREGVLYWGDEPVGANITVDSSISPTSENPVQNKVIYTALAAKVPFGYTSYNAASSIAIGNSSTVYSAKSVAAGYGSSTSAPGAEFPDNTGGRSVAIGYYASTDSADSIALGAECRVAYGAGTGQTAVGHGASIAVSTKGNSTVLGNCAAVGCDPVNSTAIGANSFATGLESTAIGAGARVEAQHGTMVGSAETNYDDNSILLAARGTSGERSACISVVYSDDGGPYIKFFIRDRVAYGDHGVKVPWDAFLAHLLSSIPGAEEFDEPIGGGYSYYYYY